MRRLAPLLLLVSVIIGIVPASSARSAAPATSNSIPAPTPGVRPTIALNPSHGYAGQNVTVSGQGVASSPGVRVAWLTSAATRTMAVVNRQPSNVYSATISVPSDAAIGAGRVCAAITGTATAEFACADFTIDMPPPGSIQGTIPVAIRSGRALGPQSISASLNLYNTSGVVIARAPISSDGSFTIPSVPPGTYTAGVSGHVPVLVQDYGLQVWPGAATNIQMSAISALQCILAQVTDASATPSAVPLDGSADFGTYVALGPSGSPVNVTFNADVQYTADIDRVDFAIEQPDGSRIPIGSAASAPYQASYNVSLLPEGISTLYATPMVKGQLCSALTKAIKVISDPMQDPNIQPGTGQTIWDGSSYHYQGIIPNVGGLLPITYPDPPPHLPLIGTIETKLDAGFQVEGDLALDGSMNFVFAGDHVMARLLGIDILNSSHSALTFGSWPATADPRQISLSYGPHTLASFHEDIPVYQGPVWTFWGIVTVYVSFSVGIGGRLFIQGTVRPLEPALDATLTAEGDVSTTVFSWADALLGVADAGSGAQLQTGIDLPLRLNTDDPRKVWLDDPCLHVKFTVSAWVSYLWGLGNDEASKTLIDYILGNCEPLPSQMVNTRVPITLGNAPPRLMSAPTVASGPAGRMLSTYIQDTTPYATMPTPKVMVRFWNTTMNSWDDPMPLTDGSHTVQHPEIAFIGTSGNAIAAWTENTESYVEGQAAGNNLNMHLKRQEIFYAVWNGTSWSQPVRLTNDLLPDGSAALAGDATGATLAWVRATGGDISNRTAWRIAVTQMDANSGTWSPIELLQPPGTAAPVMNAQVSAARNGGQTVLAWTMDTDGQLTTNSDRHIVIGSYDSIKQQWVVGVPAALPTGADSPSIALGSPEFQQGVQLAFLVRGKDGDGKTDTGIGNQAVLWTAQSSPSGSIQIAPVRDERGRLVRAERPRLSTNGHGETLLLFRRFGDVGTNGELGQLALSQLTPNQSTFTPPLYLTDEPRQHWQPALAVNSATGQALILNVGRAALGRSPATASTRYLQAPGDMLARPELHTSTLATGDDPIESIALDAVADPALDPALMLSQQHAAPGSTVVMTATVRNLGRAPASGLAVNFYSGLPGSGTLLGTVNLPDALDFNQSRAVAFQITSSTGAQPVYAEVTTSDADTNTANDRATAALGALTPPINVNVTSSTRTPTALEITWLPSEVAGVAGYRILRSQASGGPYELVGEATRTSYSDLLLQQGHSYYYVVEAYDASGVLSSDSLEVSGTLPYAKLYLPMVMR